MFPPTVTIEFALSSESSATVTTRTLSLSLCLKLTTRALFVFISSPRGFAELLFVEGEDVLGVGLGAHDEADLFGQLLIFVVVSLDDRRREHL